MDKYENVGISLKLMHVLSGVHLSTLYKYAQKEGIEPMASSNRRNLRYSIDSTRRLLGHFFSEKHKIDQSKKKIAGFHFKGGTGKSSISVELAVMLSLLGYKVLLFDADQQGHSSSTLGLDYSQNLYTFYDCIKNNLSLSDIIIHLYEGLDCVPANLSLAQLDELLKEVPPEKRFKLLNENLKAVEDVYDFIIFDTAPSITDLNRNVFYTCRLLNVVCDTQPQSVQSLSHIWLYMKEFCEKEGVPFPDVMILPNKYEERVASSTETMAYLQGSWGEYIIRDFAIRKSEDFPKAFLEQLPLTFFCKVNSIAFEDMAEVTRSLVQKCELNNALPIINKEQ